MSAAGPLTADEWSNWYRRGEHQPPNVQQMPNPLFGRDKRPSNKALPQSAAAAMHARTPLAAVEPYPQFAWLDRRHHSQDKTVGGVTPRPTWRAQQRWRDWSWGREVHTWGGRSSRWDVQESPPATWPGDQWGGHGEPDPQQAWEHSESSHWQQEKPWPQGRTWWQQQQEAKLWEYYQGPADRARGASSRAQTQGGHKRRKGEQAEQARSKSQHGRAWADVPAQPSKLKGRNGAIECAGDVDAVKVLARYASLGQQTKLLPCPSGKQYLLAGRRRQAQLTLRNNERAVNSRFESQLGGQKATPDQMRRFAEAKARKMPWTEDSTTRFVLYGEDPDAAPSGGQGVPAQTEAQELEKEALSDRPENSGLAVPPESLPLRAAEAEQTLLSPPAEEEETLAHQAPMDTFTEFHDAEEDPECLETRPPDLTE
eukprot:5591028-Amphidinium_carterae.2